MRIPKIPRIPIPHIWMVRTKRWGVLLVAAVIVFFIMDIVIMPWYTRQNDVVMVPDVMGLKISDAQDLLMSEGYRIVEKGRTDPNVAPGTVIQQAPPASSHVKRGRKITLTVSEGLAPVIVPKVQGSQREAEISIANAALRLGRIEYAVSDHYPEGVVMFQSIAAGSRVSAGTYIDVTISLGRVERSRTIPDVRNNNFETALRTLIKVGLVAGQIDTAIYTDFLPNTVLWQSPASGATAQYGDTINLIVSTIDTTYQYPPHFQRFLDSLITAQKLQQAHP